MCMCMRRVYATSTPPRTNLSVRYVVRQCRRWVSKEARSAELREKFEMAVPSIQEKLKLEAERRQKQRLDNEDLRGQLVSFAEQTKLRCTYHHALRAWIRKAGGGGFVFLPFCRFNRPITAYPSPRFEDGSPPSFLLTAKAPHSSIRVPRVRFRRAFHENNRSPTVTKCNM